MSNSSPNTSNDRIFKILACDFVELYAARIYRPTGHQTEKEKIEEKNTLARLLPIWYALKNFVTKIKTILK